MMKNITLPEIPDFDAWRTQARACLAAGLHPSQIRWNDKTETADLFNAPAAPVPAARPANSVPKDFIEHAQTAICHSDPARYALLYRVLWRLAHENPKLMKWITDKDIIALTRMVKTVRRDAYKIKAFLRFREIENENFFVAWYEPEHYTLDLSLKFFTTRFANMRWSILTPYKGAHWNPETGTLTHTLALDRSLYPSEDNVEAHWLTYYKTTFNPARLKTKAMLTQMPKKYWKNMPETALVQGLIQTAPARVSEMIERAKANNQ